jgi:Lrp/AsnC family transcriptional regulator, leucine-responsive regulatory protein
MEVLPMIDEVDNQILTIIRHDARASNAEIARQIGMAPSAIYERIRKLEVRGVIEGYEARLNPTKVGLGMLAFIFVRAAEKVGSMATGKIIAELPEVQEVHQVAGEDCYLVKVRVADTEDLGRVLRDKLGAIDSILSTRTTIVLATLKESAQLPLKAVYPEEIRRHLEQEEEPLYE